MSAWEWIARRLGSLRRTIARLGTRAPPIEGRTSGRHQDVSAAWPRTHIAAVHDGNLVKIVGRVRHADTAVIAPISSRRCVAWESVIDPRGEHRARRADQTDFLVEDHTGMAGVRIAGASLRLFGGRFRTGRLDSWVAVSLFGLARHPGREFLTFREAVLAEGDVVAVVGRATATAALHRHAVYREAVPQLVLASRDEEPLIVVKNPRRFGGRRHRSQ